MFPPGMRLKNTQLNNLCVREIIYKEFTSYLMQKVYLLEKKIEEKRKI